MIGTQLGRYHVVEALGEGGMATVYKGYDNRLKRDVAIKVILRGYERRDIFSKRFEREAMAVAQLTHPNIVQVIDYGDQDGLPYLVMEYIPGGTLKDRMGEPIPYIQAAKMLAPIARALDYAHKENIVHRDVKPANILITKTDDLMLSDFGIAKSLGADQLTDLTGSGVGIGTPAYMAPEQGLGKGTDFRIDIYSLGVVFYEMITGRPPYEADTPIAVMLKHISAPLPRPRQFVPDIPEKVEQTLFKALSKDPNHRYQTMEEFAQKLENLSRRKKDLPGQTKLEKTYTVPQTHDKPVKRRPKWLIWLFASVALICASSVGGILLGGSYLISQRSTKTQAAISLVETATPKEPWATIEQKYPLFEETPTQISEISSTPSKTILVSDTPIPSPTETSVLTWRQGILAFVSRNGDGNSLYTMDLVRDSEPILVYNPGGNIKLMAPDWSPDSSQIAFSQYGGNLHLIDASGSGLKSLYPCRRPSWSSNGEQILCYAGGTNTFDILDASSGQALRSIDAPAGGIFPVLSPLGDMIAYPAFDGDLTRVWRMTIDGSLSILLAGESSENYAPSWSPDGQWIAYQSNHNSQMSDIWIMDSAGGNKRRITDTSGSHWSRAPSWSPDGQWLAFVSDQAGSFGADYGEIFIVSVVTGEIIQVTYTEGVVYDWRVSWGK